MKNVPEGYKKEHNRLIPIDWDFIKINDLLCKVGNKVNVNNQELYQQIGIRSHGKGIFYKDFVTGEELGNKSVFWVEKNCFIVNIVFAWEQAIARTTENEVGMICSHRFPMYRPINNKVDIDYLVYLFNTQYGKKVLELASPGGAGRNKTLGQKEFANSEILIPNSIEEQQKIVEIIDKYEALIEFQKQIIVKKKHLKEGIMQRLLSGKVRFKEFNEDWKSTKIGEILKEDKVVAVEGDINKRLTIRLNLKGIEKREVKNTEIEGATTHYIRKAGQFIYGKQNLHKGAFGIIPKELDGYQSSSDLPSFNFEDGFYPLWFFYYLSRVSYYRQLEKIATGTGSKRVQPKELMEIKIKVPRLKEQIKIANYLKLLDDEIKVLEKELETFELQKKGIMQRLLMGAIRVKI